MIGQDRLLKELEKVNLTSFPKSVLLLGEKGCGKHTYLNMIVQKLGLDSLDVTAVIDFEYILKMYERSIPSIYYIDMDKFTEKKQNIILKVLEEPPANAYIILLSSNKSLLLETIVNRCAVYEFKKYTFDELDTFVTNKEYSKLICSVFNTPGQILQSNIDNIKAMYDLCYTIIEKLKVSAYYNALTIANKINYSDEYDKFDMMAFFNMMNYVILEAYEKGSSEEILVYLKKTLEFKRNFEKDNRLDKQRLFENYISEMWIALR